MERTDDGEDAREDVRPHARARRRQRWFQWNLLRRRMEVCDPLVSEVKAGANHTLRSSPSESFIAALKLFLLTNFHTSKITKKFKLYNYS